MLVEKTHNVSLLSKIAKNNAKMIHHASTHALQEKTIQVLQLYGDAL